MAVITIDTILGLGDDQLVSQFYCTFPTGIPGVPNTEFLSLRMDQTFDPPKREVGTYDIMFMGMKIPKTNYTEQTDKMFMLPFRLDQGWTVYDALDNWLRLGWDEEKGTGAPDVNTRVPMVVQCFGPDKTLVKSITYDKVKLKGLKITSWDNNGTDPSRVECDFIFLKTRTS